jgi:hypothetical protein
VAVPPPERHHPGAGRRQAPLRQGGLLIS